jgi:hypothetical protein
MQNLCGRFWCICRSIVVKNVRQRENSKVKDTFFTIDRIEKTARITMKWEIHMNNMLFFFIHFTVEPMHLFHRNVQWVALVELAIPELKKKMFRVSKLTSFLELDTHPCHITILNKLGLDLGSLNASNQLNAHIDIACLCVCVDKNTSKKRKFLITVNGVPGIEVAIVPDLQSKISYISILNTILGRLGVAFGAILGGLAARFGVAVGMVPSSPVSSSLASCSC